MHPVRDPSQTAVGHEAAAVDVGTSPKNDAPSRLGNELHNRLESTQIATLFLDMQLCITGFTPAMTGLFDLHDEDRGRPITEIASRIDYPDLVKDADNALRTLDVTEREVRSVTDNITFLLRMRPYRTQEDVVEGLVLTFVDITRELERAHLAAIVESSNDAIIGHALDGTIISWNAGAQRIFGYSASHAIGRPLDMLVASKEAATLQAMLPGLEHGQRGSHEEMIWLKQDGAPVHISQTSSPVRDSRGRIVGAATIVRDVTERRQQALEMRFASLIEQAPVGVAQADLTGRFVLVNPRFCEMVDRSAADLTALNLIDVIEPGDRAVANEALARLRRENQPAQIEWRYVRPDGADNYAVNSLTVVLDALGRPRHIMLVALDITEQRRTQAHLKLLLGELNHRVKNTLASVQAIALQTLRSTPGLDAFREDFLSRLLALSNTHNLLALDAWTGVGLRHIILNELAPYEDHARPRVEISGDDLKLAPKAALALGMALHELVTNAGKYGALSTPHGKVVLQWNRVERDGQPWLHLLWSEHDGPAVTPPTRNGFGSRLICDGLPYELGGHVALEFEASGVVCNICIPLEEQHESRRG